MASSSDNPPPSAYIDGVVGYPQERNLSCESRSAVDLAAFWGVPVSEAQFLGGLPSSDNPYTGFIGNVDAPAGSMPPVGYGVYAPAVAANLRGHGLDAQARRWLTVRGLQREIAAGRPVIVWATYDMLRAPVQLWASSDGSRSAVVQWQHTFIAVGYDAYGVYLVDAYDAETKYFTYTDFVPAWMQLNQLAVTVSGLSTSP